MSAPERARPQQRRSAVLLAVAAVLVVGVVGLVLVFGIAHPPALEDLSDHPTPALDAAVAWAEWTSDGNCLHVARPEGEVEALRCERDGGEVAAWTDDGILLRSWEASGEQMIVIDAATGDVIDRRRVGAGVAQHLPEGVRSEHRDGRLVVTPERGGGVIWEVDAPENYTVTSSAVSPDGRWVAMVDSAERLLVVPADGSAPPRIWAEDVPSWLQLVWEGTQEGTQP